MENAIKVYADPQKSFFIDMLTRDIGIIECILDLIDNSIHNLIRTSDVDVMKVLTSADKHKLSGNSRIDIIYNKNSFTIIDNCGGIEKEDAINDVFLFGRKKKIDPKPGLGLYGVGMKRAIFKIGKKINIISKTKKDIFFIPIDVDKWREEKEWELRLYNYTKKAPLEKPGVYIHITDLIPEISKRINAPAFNNELLNRIALAYSLFISSGLKITLNDSVVNTDIPTFETRAARPARKEFNINGVKVLIIAGLTSKQHRRPEGWYIFCNGRLILPRSQDSSTGWGVDSFPRFHSKYNHFLGHVYFTSKNLELLPWTTTKREVNLDSPIYQDALVEMKLIARPVLNELAKLYPTEADEESIIQREIFLESEATPITKLPRKDRLFKISSFRRALTQDVTISFKKPRDLVKKAKSSIGSETISNRELGEYIFDYYIKKECEQ